jgi:hypothetical protein
MHHPENGGHPGQGQDQSEPVTILLVRMLVALSPENRRYEGAGIEDHDAQEAGPLAIFITNLVLSSPDAGINQGKTEPDPAPIQHLVSLFSSTDFWQLESRYVLAQRSYSFRRIQRRMI